jgi:hypothetical protein
VNGEVGGALRDRGQAVTSPPYFGLRDSHGVVGQIGLEPFAEVA